MKLTDGSGKTTDTPEAAVINADPQTRTVSYDYDENAPSTAVKPDAETVDYGTEYTAKEPTSVSGWTFDGWYTDADCTTKFTDGTAITENTTLHGKWSYGLDITKTVDKANVTAGDTVTYTITVTNSTAADVSVKSVTDKLSADLTFVSADNDGVNDNGTITWTNVTVPADSSKELKVTATVSATLTEAATISNTATLTDSNDKVTTTPEATVTAATQTFTVTWVDENGNVLEEDKEVPYGTTPSYGGTTPTKAADAEYTYQFKGWTPEISPVTGDVTYKAVYTATKIAADTVDYHFSGDVPEGAVIPDSDEIKPGEKFDVTDEIEPGEKIIVNNDDGTTDEYIFDGWYTDPDCTEKFVDGTELTGDTQLYGRWVKLPRTGADDVPVYTWIIMMLTAAIASAAALIMRRQRH